MRSWIANKLRKMAGRIEPRHKIRGQEITGFWIDEAERFDSSAHYTGYTEMRWDIWSSEV